MMASRTPKRLTAVELAALMGVSQSNIDYRVARGHLSAPGTDGKFDVQRALRDFERHPKTKRGRPGQLRPKPGRGVIRERETGSVEETYDPDTRFRLAKARQEEIKLKRMLGQTVDLRAAKQRAFRIIRTWRDAEDAAISREAPLIAARLGVDEGTLWRELRQFMSTVQTACADLRCGEGPRAGCDRGR